MKLLMIIWCACIASLQILVAEEPQLILPKTKVIHPLGWYSAQQQLWADEVKRHRKDPKTWLNYYAASRYAGMGDSELDLIVSNMAGDAAHSFEFALVKGWHLGNTLEGFKQIALAYNLQPQNASTYASMLLFSDIENDRSERAQFSQKLLASGLLSSSLLHYSYNVLMSVEQGGVLITEGENTAVPLYVLQDVFDVREDVKVVQLELLTTAELRTKILSNHRLLLNDGVASATNNTQAIAIQLPIQNPSYKFFYGLTLTQDNVSSIREQLYVVGLASQKSSERLDNLKVIQRNIESRFLLDYLTVDFNGESEFASGRVLSANYLVPMLMLHEFYREKNEMERANDLYLLIQKIAIQSGKEQLVNNYLAGKQAQVPYFPHQLDLKEIEGIFKKVKDNVYAQEYEVTNVQYNTFLNYLHINGQDGLYSKFNFDLSRYEEPALSFMKTYTANRVATKKDKYFTRYPAVNISYESAVAYCEWLTDQYNKQAGRKYKKVKFRLPSIKEWQIAALGYAKVQTWELDENNVEVGIPKNATDELTKDHRTIPVKGNDILYPWYRSFNYRNKVLNSRGCSLGNFKFPDDQKPCLPAKMISVDGFVMMSMVQAYFPNDIGLYDVVGNVSEMTEEKGKSCGGSWNHVPEESTIRSVNNYDRPDPAVGFRVFMEVLEQ
ncbi:formylglycine-generating enzyme family protein [Pseudochryseolinea flava]|nr:SUMF1/EgtB/PvdO family nonheme iron enzyme [Pseudochryseolinea flava]